MKTTYQSAFEEMVISGKGLTTAEAEALTKKWGKNEIPEEKEPVRPQAPSPPSFKFASTAKKGATRAHRG